MKTILTLLVATMVIMSPIISSGNDDGATLTGALLGAAGGLIVANNADHVSRAVAVPVGALAGGLLANAAENHDWRHYGHYDSDWDYPSYGHWDHWSQFPPDYRDRHHRSRPRVVVMQDLRPTEKQVEQPKPPDLHPGVDLIKISISLSNGTPVDIPVLRIGDRFVGPQGEEYSSLPTAKQLAEKYAK